LNIQSLYRVTSHHQLSEVDDASTSLNKVSKQVIIFRDNLPDTDTLNQYIKATSIGVALVVDAFDAANYNTFDYIIGCEQPLMVTSEETIDEQKAIVCLPQDYLTFYIGQELSHEPKIFSVKVITLSDRAYRGIYEDKSGPLAVEMLYGFFEKAGKKANIDSIIIPDKAEELENVLEDCKYHKTDLLITTGGTGIGRRDITIETVGPFIDKEIPGIMEMIRVKYGANKPNALLSRGISGIMKETLVFTLPGGANAVNEYLTEIFRTLDHLFYMLHGIDNH
jgi:molybdenum cofactor synthesis domain-containing protein